MDKSAIGSGKVTLETVEEPSPADCDAILSGLRGFNQAQAGPGGHHSLCIVLRDQSGGIEGGLWGTTAYDWLFIELLFVPEHLRGGGSGSALIRSAEDAARARGCIGAWLDTFSFQARGFYEKLGYTLVGTISDHPRGGARHFMMKRWTP